MKILVTGGAGYIGSHTCVELLNAGYEIVVLDNLYNASEKCLDAVKKLTGKDFPFYKVDLLDKEATEKVFAENKIDAVIHFAGLKAVGESTRIPLTYYDNNITGTLHLMQAMEKYDCNNIVFSSSATVYGDPERVPIVETDNKGDKILTTNPYGTTKLFIERIMTDAQKANPKLSVTLLRYFNPIGAHESGIMGEDPKGIPNNLLPYIAQVAVGKLEKVHVFGNDYPTPDGTGVRDYIHVVDLAKGHLCAVKYVMENKGVEAVNLGTGKGSSVYDVLHSFEKACGKKLPYVVKPRRAGDIATCYADTAKAKKVFGWEAQYGLDEMTADSWNFIKNNPNGL